jgi:hypothetical protein
MYGHQFDMSAGSHPQGRPTILFGGSVGVFGSPQRAVRLAHREGYLAVDLDMRHGWLPPAPAATDALGRDRLVRLRSVWLPAAMNGPLLTHRLDRLTTFLRLAEARLGLRQVIVAGSTSSGGGTSLLRVVRGSVGANVRLAIGVRADRTINSLTSTAHARRVAEEWDLDLALDLSGPIPPGWEAEAAVMRMVPRLTLVRLCGWLPGASVDVNESPTRIAARSIAMLADQGYAGLVSIVPTRNHHALDDYQHDIHRRYRLGPSSTDTPARTYFDLP